MESNPLLSEIIHLWYDYFEKYESENMISILNDNIVDFNYMWNQGGMKEYYPTDCQSMVDYIEDKNVYEILENIDSVPESKLKKDFIELINIFLERNPRFKNDW